MRFAAHLCWPLAAVVVVQLTLTQASAQTRTGDSDIRSLARAAQLQLQLNYRSNLPEFTRRNEQIRAALAAWQASPRSAADREAMTGWLRQAIRDSMPGSHQALPPLPKFVARPSQSSGNQTASSRPHSVMRRQAATADSKSSSPSTTGKQSNDDPSTHRQPNKPSIGDAVVNVREMPSTDQQPVADGSEQLSESELDLFESNGASLWDDHPAESQWFDDLPSDDAMDTDPFVDDPVE